MDRGNVKLGFDAPPDTLILRAELKEAVAKENQKALKEASNDTLGVLGKHFKP